jgi:ankyrin repeat protein
MEGNKEIAELLIAAGADLNAKTESGETPLELAIDLKQTKIADLLRKHGADLKQTKYNDLLRKLGGKTGEELKVEGK